MVLLQDPPTLSLNRLRQQTSPTNGTFPSPLNNPHLPSGIRHVRSGSLAAMQHPTLASNGGDPTALSINPDASSSSISPSVSPGNSPTRAMHDFTSEAQSNGGRATPSVGQHSLNRQRSNQGFLGVAGNDGSTSPLPTSTVFSSAGAKNQERDEPLTPTASLLSISTPAGQESSPHEQGGHAPSASAILTEGLRPSVGKETSASPIATFSGLPSTSSSISRAGGDKEPNTPVLSTSSSSMSKSTSGSGEKGGSAKDTASLLADNPYKSFRVTLDDPCYKVLPAALKKYKINDDWRQYALFICYGSQGTGNMISIIYLR